MDFYIGVTPANEPSNEIGVCILDNNLNITYLDRFNSIKEFNSSTLISLIRIKP